MLVEQQRHAEALEHLLIAVESPTTGNRRTLYSMIGRCLANLGDVDESMRYLDRALSIEKQRQDRPGSYAILAEGLMDQGLFEAAEDVLQRAVEVDPQHIGALQMRAELARKRGRLAEAEAGYRKVLAIDDGHGLARAGLGTVLFRQKRFAQALEHLRLAVELPGTDEVRDALHLFMGQSAGELGRLEEAEAHLAHAIAAMPDNVLTLLALADLRARQGRDDEAFTYRRRVRAMHPDDPMLAHRIAESFRKEGHIDEAIATYEKAIELDPGNAPARAGLGIALYQRGHFRAAVDSMTRALEMRPDLPYAVSLRLYSGHSLRELGNIPGARAQYELAVEVDAGNRDALNHLAVSLLELKRYEEAHRRYVELGKIDPDNAVAHADHGEVLHRLGRHEEALASVQRALELDPELKQAHILRQEVRKALGLRDAP